MTNYWGTGGMLGGGGGMPGQMSGLVGSMQNAGWGGGQMGGGASLLPSWASSLVPGAGAGLNNPPMTPDYGQSQPPLMQRPGFNPNPFGGGAAPIPPQQWQPPDLPAGYAQSGGFNAAADPFAARRAAAASRAQSELANGTAQRNAQAGWGQAFQNMQTPHP